MSLIMRRALLALAMVSSVLVTTAVIGAPGAAARCAPTESFKITGKTAGWSKTNVSSEWIAGPATIQRTVSKSTADTWGGSASLKISLGAILAKAETTFSINYSHTTTRQTGFSYSVSIPRQRTGRMVRLHREDRISIRQTLRGEDCKVHSSTQYAYLPRAGKTSGYYCTIRDLTPAMASWKQSCTNSD
jgi:hypothetical protein